MEGMLIFYLNTIYIDVRFIDVSLSKTYESFGAAIDN